MIRVYRQNPYLSNLLFSFSYESSFAVYSTILRLSNRRSGSHRRKGDIARKRAETKEPAGCCVVENTGIQSLLDKAVSDIGLAAPLAAVFPDDWKCILTCAYYLISEGGALCHLEQWQRMFPSPCRCPLASQRVSELFVRITSTLQQNFFSKWIDVHRQNDVYAMDITSVSSYSEWIDFVRWEYNRDGEKLPQINLLMLTGVISHMPLCITGSFQAA